MCEIWNKRDFVPPKMSWNQTKEIILLKVYLKNVSQADTVFKGTSISFRLVKKTKIF